jgi:hypothetical protein
LKTFFLKNGHLTDGGAGLLGILGVLVLGCVAFFFENWSGFWFWLLALIGGGLGYVGAYGGLAKKFGFEAPFTNDPLGWRNAKKSYQDDSNESARRNPD